MKLAYHFIHRLMHHIYFYITANFTVDNSSIGLLVQLLANSILTWLKSL